MAMDNWRSFFIMKFQSLAEQQIYVIAPEGLSRYYLTELTEQGRKDNKVGASWMTRENREMDIRNYITYLDMVFARELDAFPHIPVSLVGFSQGSATATRWAIQGNLRFDKLILWSGLFPPDMDFTAGHEKLKDKKSYLVVGKNDPFLNEARMLEFDQLASKIGVQPQKIYFEGKHEISEVVFPQLIKG